MCLCTALRPILCPGSLAKGMQAFIDDNQHGAEEAVMVIEKMIPLTTEKKSWGMIHNQDEKVYGNNIITAHEGTPHTNVSGIIAGLRNNGLEQRHHQCSSDHDAGN